MSSSASRSEAYSNSNRTVSTVDYNETENQDIRYSENICREKKLIHDIPELF